MAPRIASLIRKYLTGRYFEPFLGGGAVFFQLSPSASFLSDINGDLVNTYLAVRDNVAEVVGELRRMRVSRSQYYRIRASSPRNQVVRAARFLYLNRTAFSGLYRLNSSGQFNVPYGGGHRTPAVLLNSSLLQDAAHALVGATIRQCDFENAIGLARKGDVIYCDPTYTVTHNQNGFVRYNEENFSWIDQERLAKAAQRAATRGATVIISNADHNAIRKLYRKAEFATLWRNSTLSVDPSKRTLVKELLITCRNF